MKTCVITYAVLFSLQNMERDQIQEEMTSRDSSDQQFLAGEEEGDNQLDVIKVRKSQRGV